MMKNVPGAFMLTVAGIIGEISAIDFKLLWLAIVSGVAIVVGLIWFNWCWDDYQRKIKKLRRDMDKLMADCAECAIMTRAANRKASDAEKAAKKSTSQRIKGCIRSANAQEAIMLNHILSS